MVFWKLKWHIRIWIAAAVHHLVARMSHYTEAEDGKVTLFHLITLKHKDESFILLATTLWCLIKLSTVRTVSDCVSVQHQNLECAVAEASWGEPTLSLGLCPAFLHVGGVGYTVEVVRGGGWREKEELCGQLSPVAAEEKEMLSSWQPGQEKFEMWMWSGCCWGHPWWKGHPYWSALKSWISWCRREEGTIKNRTEQEKEGCCERNPGAIFYFILFLGNVSRLWEHNWHGGWFSTITWTLN